MAYAIAETCVEPLEEIRGWLGQASQNGYHHIFLADCCNKTSWKNLEDLRQEVLRQGQKMVIILLCPDNSSPSWRYFSDNFETFTEFNDCLLIRVHCETGIYYSDGGYYNHQSLAPRTNFVDDYMGGSLIRMIFDHRGSDWHFFQLMSSDTKLINGCYIEYYRENDGNYYAWVQKCEDDVGWNNIFEYRLDGFGLALFETFGSNGTWNQGQLLTWDSTKSAFSQPSLNFDKGCLKETLHYDQWGVFSKIAIKCY